MPQNVPAFQFSDDALRVRQFVYEYWCRHGHGPFLRTAHEATGLGRQKLLEVYRELDLGLVLTVDHATQQGAILKCQPFSSYPSQVEVYLDGRFHCWAGCAMESIAISLMPPFAGKELRLESYCACCLVPVSLTAKDGAILERTPASTLIHVSHSPRDWNTTNIVCMCDGMNFVHDAEHALAYERQISRRGVVLTIEQAQRFVAGTGQSRMHRYDWEPVPLIPERVIAGLKALGVDVSPWEHEMRVVAALIVAAGVAAAGWFVGEGFRLGRQADRLVSVKGISEREVKADLVLWPLRFVAAGDELATVQAKSRADADAVRRFLTGAGVPAEAIEVQGIEVTDVLANQYRSGPTDSRFIVAQTLMVRTTDVDRIAAVSQRLGELVDAGVVLSSEGGGSGPYYLFTKLNDIKPAMIAEATKRAREGAEQFAADSGSRVGGIHRANQGLFQILARDDTPGTTEQRQVAKTVRVVSTVDYRLID